MVSPGSENQSVIANDRISRDLMYRRDLRLIFNRLIACYEARMQYTTYEKTLNVFLSYFKEISEELGLNDSNRRTGLLDLVMDVWAALNAKPTSLYHTVSKCILTLLQTEQLPLEAVLTTIETNYKSEFEELLGKNQRTNSTVSEANTLNDDDKPVTWEIEVLRKRGITDRDHIEWEDTPMGQDPVLKDMSEQELLDLLNKDCKAEGISSLCKANPYRIYINEPTDGINLALKLPENLDVDSLKPPYIYDSNEENFLVIQGQLIEQFVKDVSHSNFNQIELSIYLIMVYIFGVQPKVLASVKKEAIKTRDCYLELLEEGKIFSLKLNSDIFFLPIFFYEGFNKYLMHRIEEQNPKGKYLCGTALEKASLFLPKMNSNISQRFSSLCDSSPHKLIRARFEKGRVAFNKSQSQYLINAQRPELLKTAVHFAWKSSREQKVIFCWWVNVFKEILI